VPLYEDQDELVQVEELRQVNLGSKIESTRLSRRLAQVGTTRRFNQADLN